ncbi:MAG TPA: hypothetical protein DC014_06895 [Treponema sp.]|jgi:predicted transcriptional regulator|nr:hypothetical protein [Treponema sp.]
MTLSDVTAQVKEFIQRQTKLSLTISGILIFFVLGAVVIGLVYASKGNKKRITIPYDETFVAVDEFLAPNAPSIVQDYYYSRQKDGQWDSEDEERWFTSVDQSLLNDLGEQNQHLADTITGAAP